MFLGQAALQFELWTGQGRAQGDHALGVGRAAMNLVLVGYRGTGKSVIAFRLAGCWASGW